MPTYRRNQEKTLKAYAFFERMEASKQPFTEKDIEHASGYRKGVVHIYRSKKWKWFLIEKDGFLYCQGLYTHSKDYFMQLHSQVYHNVDTLPRSNILPASNQPAANRIFVCILLLMLIERWYRFTRKHRIKIWHIYLPLWV